MKSIIQDEANRVCFLCGRNGMSDPLDRHHVFNGYGLREKSEQYGLTVYLCHYSCHVGGDNAVHRNRQTADYLKSIGQRVFMEKHGVTTEQFIKIFGRNYIE